MRVRLHTYITILIAIAFTAKLFNVTDVRQLQLKPGLETLISKAHDRFHTDPEQPTLTHNYYNGTSTRTTPPPNDVDPVAFLFKGYDCFTAKQVTILRQTIKGRTSDFLPLFHFLLFPRHWFW